jgi:hypothetical protein
VLVDTGLAQGQEEADRDEEAKHHSTKDRTVSFCDSIERVIRLWRIFPFS